MSLFHDSTNLFPISIFSFQSFRAASLSYAFLISVIVIKNSYASKNRMDFHQSILYNIW